MSCNRKVSRSIRIFEKVQKSRPKKRKQYFNPKTDSTEEIVCSASRKKIRLGDEVTVPQDNSIEFRILNFITVFSAISELVKCKKCNSDVKFDPTDT